MIILILQLLPLSLAFKFNKRYLIPKSIQFEDEARSGNFMPFSEEELRPGRTYSQLNKETNSHRSIVDPVVSMSAIVLADGASKPALAATSSDSKLAQMFDPSVFQPVCPTSDGIYQILKGTANGLVGSENVAEYGPLIASVLLRVRLEICVLESFLYEAVVPFINQKGISWILPLHETLESFLAGTIFAVACNVILLGSTKVVSIVFIYFDVLTGMPTRFIGGLLKNVKSTQVVGSVMKLYGEVVGTLRNLLESIDTFVGRYLVLATSAYVAFKFLHYKVFNVF